MPTTKKEEKPEHKPSLPTIEISGKAYVPVSARIQEFHKRHPAGFFVTKILESPPGTVRIECRVYPDGRKILVQSTESAPESRVFIGHAEEKFGSSMVNKTSALENAETSAVGRALGMLGIGIDEAVASYEEMLVALAEQPLASTVYETHSRPAKPRRARATAGTKPGPYLKQRGVLARAGDPCPTCGSGVFLLRNGSNGPFLSCSNWKALGCPQTADILPELGDVPYDQASDTETLPPPGHPEEYVDPQDLPF